MKPLYKYGLAILLLFGWMYLSMSPNLQYIRDTNWYDIGIFAIIFVGVAVTMFLKELHTSIPSKIVLGLIFLYPFLRLLDLSTRVFSLIIYFHGIVLILTVVGVELYKYNNHKKNMPFEKYPLIVGLLQFIIACSIIMDVDYIDKAGDPWLVILIISAGLMIISIFVVIRYKDDIRDRQNLYCIPLLVLMGGFCFGYLSYLFFNYSFDTSVPIEYSAEIIEMDIDTGGRSMTTYDLTIIIEGEEYQISTSQSRYYQLNVGDEIIVNRYQGAFNYEYMIYEP